MDKKDNLPDNKSIDFVIPISRIIELRKRGNSYKEIGKILGCTKQNVDLRLRPFKAEIEALESFKEHKADVLGVYQQKLLNSLTDSDIKRMPPGSRLTGFGILYDKERLERSLSTENVSYADYTEKISQEREIQAENLRKIKDIEAEEAELKAQLKAIESKSSGTGSKDD
jgi:type I restriction-modification system DNA methylase subunit